MKLAVRAYSLGYLSYVGNRYMDTEKARSKIIETPIKELRNDLLLEAHLQMHLSKYSILPGYQFPSSKNKDIGSQTGCISQNSKGTFMIKYTAANLKPEVVSDAYEMLKAHQRGGKSKVTNARRKKLNLGIYRNHYELLMEYLSSPLFDYFLMDRTASVSLVLPSKLETTTYLCVGKIHRKSFAAAANKGLVFTRSKFIENFVTMGAHLGYDSGDVLLHPWDKDRIRECGDVDSVALPSFFLGDTDCSISNYGLITSSAQSSSSSYAAGHKAMKVDHGKSLMVFFSSLEKLSMVFQYELHRTNFDLLKFHFESLCHTMMKFAYTPNVFFETQILRRAYDLSFAGYKSPNMFFYYLDDALQVIQFKDRDDNTLEIAKRLIQRLEMQLSLIRVMHLNLVVYRMTCAELQYEMPQTLTWAKLPNSIFKSGFIASVLANQECSSALKEKFIRNNAEFIVANNLSHMLNLPFSFFSRDVVECLYECKTKLHLQDPLQYALTHDMAISGKNPVIWFLQHYNREDLGDGIKQSIHTAMLDFCKNFAVHHISADLASSQAIELRNFIHRELELNYKNSSNLSVLCRNECNQLKVNIGALERISISNCNKSIKADTQNGRDKV